MTTIFENATTKMSRLYNFMRTGKPVTPGLARSRFGVKNLRATVSDIREVLHENNPKFTIVRGETNNGTSNYRLARIARPHR